MAKAKPDTVAIVDDDHAARESLRFLLETVGHKVETFAAAADFLRAEFRRVACLLLDHHMPGMTGLELAEHLKRGRGDNPDSAYYRRAIVGHRGKNGEAWHHQSSREAHRTKTTS